MFCLFCTPQLSYIFCICPPIQVGPFQTSALPTAYCDHRWNQDFELLVHEPEHQQLTAVLLEHHALDQDDEVGRVSIPIEDLPVGETQDLWLGLGPAGADQQNSLLSLSVSHPA